MAEYASVLEDISKIFNKIKTKARKLIKIFNAVDTTISFAEQQNIIFKVSFVEALSLLSKQLFNIINNVVLLACINTVEYNYEPYINRLTSAIKRNINSIVSIIPDYSSETLVVKVDFSVLGTPEEWLAATEAVVGELGVGKIPNIKVRSKIWREKIYGAGREGGRVKRRKRDGTEYDITERYIDTYEKTILLRLEKIREDKAPFWYFINYGNLNFGGDGEPYPKIPYTTPTRLEDELKYRIEDFFLTTLIEFKSKANTYLSKRLNELIKETLSIPYEPPIDEFKAIGDYWKNYVESNFESIDEKKISERDIVGIKEDIRKLDYEITMFIRHGKQITMYRDIKTGRFIKKL